MEKLGIFELELYTKTLTENIRKAIKENDKNIIKSHKIFKRWLQIRKK